MRLLISVLTLLALFSCTKKRDETFVQGQGKELLEIANFDGKEFEVETLEKITDYKENLAVSSSENVTHSEGSDISKMGAVKVKTDADLLGDAPFIAIPKTKTGYKIRYEVTNDYLVVLKVAKKELIHPQEQAGAKKLEGGLIGVPVVGYPVRGFYNTENVEQNGAKTNKIIEMPTNDKGSTRYFKVDKNARVLYKLQEKLDLFTREYFEGKDGKSEWYFAQTIVAAGGRNADETGTVLAQQDMELNSLSKVKFTFNRTEMRAMSANRDSRIKQEDEINQFLMVKIPIEWKEYRPAPAGTKSYAMSEEENNSVEWDMRSYVKADFANAWTITTERRSWRFVDLEVDKDYMSFTLYEPELNMRIKHSFLRDSGRKPYTAKRMLKEDFEKFGFFTTQKHEINNYEKYRTDDYGKNEFINRFNVANRVIEFYFTEGSDESLITEAAKACDAWSDAFAKAEVQLQVKCITDKNKRKKLGDLRYNQINLIRSAEESNLFGYGPSITDPRTGEIISATTNMHITSIVSALTSHIRDYLLFKSGKTKTVSVFPQPTLDSTTKVALKGDRVMLSSDDVFPFKKIPVMGTNGKLEQKTVELAQKEQSAKGLKHSNKNFGREFDIGITGKNLNQEIDKACPELETLVSQLKDAKDGDLPADDGKLVVKCAERLVPGKMMGTLLHEMGHNFGLRHNFYGSVDAMNFLSTEESKTNDQVHSSSVMEYPSFGEDRLTTVGRYDIAAIRYGYGDSIMSKNGKILPLKTNLTIDQNIALANKENAKDQFQEQKFLFCTDEDVMVGTDPMCARHDAGTTPEEVVDHIIAEYNASIADLNYRLGRGKEWYDPARVTNYRIRRFWIPLKKYYDEWRFKLNDHLGIGNEYLDNYDAKKLDQAIAEKVKDCKYKIDEKTGKAIYEDSSTASCRFHQYKRAADKIFKFSMQIATLPPKYCIGNRNGNGPVSTVEFADVRRIIMTVNKTVPSSCMDPLVKDYIKEKYSFEPKAEAGYELEDVRLDMKVKMSKTKTDWMGQPLPEAPDVIGLMPEKAIAVEILAVRTPLSLSSADKQFLPNLLDEPRYREELLSYVADRLTKGVSAQKVASTNKKIQLESNLFLEKFKYEKRFISDMVYSIFNGLDIPDKTAATKQRKKKFMVRYTDRKEILDKAKYSVVGPDGTTSYAIMTEEATEAKKLIKMLETLPKRLSAASPLDEHTFDALLEIAKNTLSADDKSVDMAKFVEFIYQVIEDEYPESFEKRSQEKRNVDKYRAHWKKVLQPEVNALRQVLSTPQDRWLSDGNNPVFLTQMLAAFPLAETKLKNPPPPNPQDPTDQDYKLWKSALELVKSSGYTLNQKTLIERIEAYKKVAAQTPQTEKTEDFFNYEELSTQMEMIMSVLRTMTEY